jgi:hypothetical protein
MGSTDQSGTERGLTMNTLVYSGLYLELNTGPDRQPMKVHQDRCYMFALSSAFHKACGVVLKDSLKR